MNKSLIFLCITILPLTCKVESQEKQIVRDLVSSCCNKNYLVFTAPDMNKDGQNPDTSFSGLYTDSNFKIQAWRMKPSQEGQQEISLMFGMPDNYEPTCPLTITFYLVAEKNSGSQGDCANIRILGDHKGTLQEIGPDFASLQSTGNFTIIEPSTNKNLENIILTTTLTSTGILPNEWVLFVFDRISPTDDGEEYSKNIYLTGVVIKYGAK